MVARILVIFAGLIALTVSAAASPKVVVSIKPVHSLVSSVMHTIGEPVLLLDGQASPHDASLRPSQATALQDAELIFWIGRDLETFLMKPLQSGPKNRTSVELIKSPGLQFPDDEHEATDEKKTTDEHDHGVDAHLWLDPQNAQSLATAIADALSTLDPTHAEQYRKNAANLRKELSALESEIAARLSPVKDRQFITFHDAYGHFAHRFGLEGTSAVTINPEARPGAARIKELRQIIMKRGVACVFAEPQFSAANIRLISGGLPVKTGVLDVMGSALPPGPSQYFSLMRDLTTDLVTCLSD